jgi:Arc/MetJ-type ribon-helix-helix transcriptional regulator
MIGYKQRRIRIMTIHLPNDVERSIEAAVKSGRFASVDEAMTKAAQLLLQELKQEAKPVVAIADFGLGSIGAMRDAAAELDEIVADAMKRRREETWRDISVE